LAIALLAAGTGVAAASSGAAGDSDEQLTGVTLDRAVSAALAETGPGTVTDTEVGDDGAAYGVEILFADGSQVEVNLDADFAVIGQEPDDDSGD